MQVCLKQTIKNRQKQKLKKWDMRVNTAAPWECHTVKENGPFVFYGSLDNCSHKNKLNNFFFDRQKPNVSSTSSSYTTPVQITAITHGHKSGKKRQYDSTFDSSASGPHLHVTGRLTEKMKLKIKVKKKSKTPPSRTLSALNAHSRQSTSCRFRVEYACILKRWTVSLKTRTELPQVSYATDALKSKLEELYCRVSDEAQLKRRCLCYFGRTVEGATSRAAPPPRKVPFQLRFFTRPETRQPATQGLHADVK